MTNFNRDAIRTKLSGPVFPVLTPFTENGSEVDYAALERYVGFLVNSGAKAIMTTVGTSRFNLLSNDEIKAVNRTMVKASSKATINIVAGPLMGSLAANIEFAQHAEEVGADAYIAFFPERWYGDQAVFEFFQTLSESVSISIMIHEMPLRSGYGGQLQYSLDLLERLVTLPGVVGIKEECMDGGYAYKLHRRLQGKCAIIGAGAMRNFMRDFHAGAKANLVGVGSFFPRVEMAFQDALKAGNFEYAHKIVRQYEDPYFDVAVELGWHPQLKETLHILGLMPPYERAPLPRLNENQRVRLKNCIEKLGWLDLDLDHIPK
jgi:4-hydroxy-tetrahydrodipicolinate synthase